MKNKLNVNFFCNNMVVYIFLCVLANLLNYFFQVILGNLLSIEEYGIYNSLNSLSANIAMIFSPLVIMICQITVANKSNLKKNKTIYKQLVLLSFLVLVMISSMGTVIFLIQKECLGINNFLLWFLFLIMIGVSGQYAMLYGFIQGLEKFEMYGFVSVLLIICKLAICVGLLHAGLGISGVIIAILLSYVITILFTWCYIKKYIREWGNSTETEKIDKKEIVRMYGITFMAQILLSFYMNGGEIIFMNLQYDKVQVGLYSSVAILGKVSLYLVSTFSIVLLPKVTAQKQQGKDTKKVLYKTVFFCFIFAAGYAVMLGTIGKYLIVLLFGERYREALTYIPAVLVLVIPLCIMILIHNYILGIRKTKIYTITFGVVSLLAIGVCYLFLQELIYVPIVLGGALWIMILLIILYVFFLNGR